MKRAVAAILFAILAAAWSPAQRGQPPVLPPIPVAERQPQFRSSIDLVHLDVSILDRNRRPVRGLTPADFTVLENGVRQQIAVFSAIDIEDPPPPTAGWMRDVAPDVRTNDAIQERRLFLILLDDATMQSDVRATTKAREIARDVIERLGPSDLAAIVFTRDNRHSQDYTADRARLRGAVDTFTAGFRDMAVDAETQSGIPGADDLYFMYSANVIESAVEMLSTLPDRRKVVVYIGQGVPVDLELGATPQAPGLSGSIGSSSLARQGLMERIRTQMGRVFQRAARANINVYTFDSCGLRAPPAPPPPQPTCVPGLEVEYLQTIAANTGARAVINNNDLSTGVAEVFEENASYYLLGYASTDPRADGKLRRLEVRVNRPGVEVRTRSGYLADKADDAKRKAKLAASPLGAALSGVLPKTDLPLQMTAAAFPLFGRNESAVAVMLGVRQPIRMNAARTIEKVDLQVTAFNVEGKAFGSKRLLADVTIRPGATGLAEYEVLSRIDLEPGRYQLRVAANVGSLSTSGSLYYDVDVPDVSRQPVTFSDVVVTASPGPVVAPRDGLRDILPVIPTTRRDFAGTDRVSAFMRVHQRGKGAIASVPIRVRIRDEHDAAVIDRTEDVPAARFTAQRSADVQVELPVARLAAGQYLLTLESGEAPSILRREIRFSVTK